MRRTVVIPAMLAAIMLVMLPGCEVDPSSIRKSLETTAQATSLYGLRKWGKEKPDAAKECATALKHNIGTELIPYLDGSQLHTSAEIAELLNSSLFKGVDPDLKELIESAAVALDAVLPVPSADKYLTADQKSYVKAFLTGLEEGCDQYLGTPVKCEIKKSHWIGAATVKKK